MSAALTRALHPVAMLMALSWMSGCSSSEAETCGDGSCTAGESCQSCPVDCGACADPCANHCTNGTADCGEEDIDCGGVCPPCFDAEIRAACGSRLNHDWGDAHEIAMSNPDGSPFTGDVQEPEYREYGGHQWLFFNDAGDGPAGKDLFYAVWMEDRGEFVVPGRLEGADVVTSEVDGNPTMDRDGNFYFVSTRDITDAISAHRGTFSFTPGSPPSASLSDIAKVQDLSRHQLPWLNMGVHVAWDGADMLFSEAYFDVTPPSLADIGMAQQNPEAPGDFLRRADAASILATVNTEAHLEYAGALSYDGLELYFTRLANLQAAPVVIACCQMVATRGSPGEPFGEPRVIAAITPERNLLHEAPSISPDGTTLYYHKHNAQTQRTELWAVTRAR